MSGKTVSRPGTEGDAKAYPSGVPGFLSSTSAVSTLNQQGQRARIPGFDRLASTA